MNIRATTARRGYIACLIAASLISGGCESFMESARSVVPVQNKAPECTPLPLETFRRDQLCYGSRCKAHCYAVTLSEASVFRIDNFSTNDHPRFRVDVTDSAMRTRATGEWTNARQPTILRESLEAGTYEVRLSALEPNTSQLRYDFKVMVEPMSSSRARSAPRPPARRRASERAVAPPTPTPAPPEPVSELDLQESADVPEPPEDVLPQEPLGPALPPCALETFIVFLEPSDFGSPIAMLGAGRKDGLQVGAIGELNREGVTVGEIEVTELLPSGSRARIVRSDSGAIRDDTIDMIDVCIKYP